MQRNKTAIVVLLLALPLMGMAKSVSSSSSSGGSRSSTSSYTKGFSSPSSSSSVSKATTSNSASRSPRSTSSSSTATSPTKNVGTGESTNTTNKSTRYGTFSSGSKDTPAATGPKSTLSQGLDKSAAQSNALKTLDSRQAAKTPIAAPTPAVSAAMAAGAGGAALGSHAFGNSASGSNSAPGHTPSVAPTYSQPPVIVNNGGGFSWGSGLTGFMLGRTMNNGTASNGNAGSIGSSSSLEQVVSGPTPDDRIARIPKPGPFDAMFGIMLRMLAWATLLGGIAALVWYLATRSRRAATAKAANYSLR